MKLWKEEPSATAEMENKKYSWLKKPFLWLSLLYAVALLAILRANYYYVDDLGRAVLGYHGWLDWSRYVTQVLSFVVSLAPKLTDISPLPQFLAVGLMSLSGLLVIYSLTGKKEISWPLLLGALPMGLSPWFLECFTYKFDAPYMALAVLVSVLPFLWWKKDEKKFYGVSFLCLLVMTMTYQAAAGVFVIETLFLAFFSWMRGEKGKAIFLWTLRAALIYVVALLTFKTFFLRPPIENYASTDIAPVLELPHVFLRNATVYLQTVWQDMNFVTQILMLTVALFWLLYVRKATKRNGIVSLLTAFLLLVSTAILSYGPYLGFEKLFLFPRGLFGMGIWFSFVLITFLSMADGKGVAKCLVLLVAWQLMTGAAAYGNALADQKRYTDFRVQLLVQDLNGLHLTGDREIRYHILGDIGKSPLVRHVEIEYPAVKRLIVSTFAGDDLWKMFYFYYYHDLAWQADMRTAAKKYMNLPVVLENGYHKIQTDGKDVLIVLAPSGDIPVQIR